MNDDFWQTPGSWGILNTQGSLGATTCPHCHKHGVFVALGGVHQAGPNANEQLFFCHCPDTNCRGLAVAVRNNSKGGIIHTMIPALIPKFDFDGVSPDVVACLQEASLCYSQRCWRATAIMIRRTLEVLCREFNCSGNSLHQRLLQFRSQVLLSDDLMNGMDVLKLLGNDAAHVESREFDSIDQKELDLAMEVTRELIRALYQHRTLVNRLNSLRKNP